MNFRGTMTSEDDLIYALAAIDRPAVSNGINLAHMLVADRLAQAGCSVQTRQLPSGPSVRWWDIRCPPPWTPEDSSVYLDAGSDAIVDYQAAPMSVATHAAPTSGTLVAGSSRGTHNALFLDSNEATSERLRACTADDVVLVAVSPRSTPSTDVVSRLEAPHDCRAAVFSVPPALWRSARDRVSAGGLLRVQVSIRREPDYLSVVTGELKAGGGPDGPSVFVFAHSCHRAPNAIDNSSGLAALVALAGRSAARLKAGWGGHINRIVFVAAPEIVGSAAWLSDSLHGQGFTSGIVLDMMAPRLGSHAALLIDLPPDYVDVGGCLGSVVTNAITEVWSMGQDKWPVRTEQFEARSDHLLTNSPAVGWPTVRLGFWPDPWNHSAADVADTVDMAGYRAGLDAAEAALAACLHQHQHQHRRGPRPGYPFDPRAFVECLPVTSADAGFAALRRNEYGALVRAAHRFSLHMEPEDGADPTWIELLDRFYWERASLYQDGPSGDQA